MARLISGLEKTNAVHQIYKPDGSGQVNPDNSARDPHYHESWELKIPLKGRLHCRFEKQKFCLEKNAALLIAPQAIHYETTPSDARRNALWLSCLFENNDLHLMLMNGRRPAHYFLSSDQKSELTALLGQPANEFCEHIAFVLARAEKKTARKMAAKWLALLFSSLASALASPPVSSRPHEIISRTIALLNNKFGEATLTVRRMAEMLNIPPKYLSSLFRRLTGVTLRQKLIRIRLERAFRQLQTGRFTVKEVATFTGWKNQFYFSNTFRRHYGLAPSKVPVRMNKITT